MPVAEASDKLGILRQNLVDAGCEENLIKSCLDYAKNGDWGAIAPLLTKHKAMLLGAVHESQKQIDCLDFLTYQIRKEHKQEE